METLLPEGRARKLAGLTPAEKRFFQAIVRAFLELGGPPPREHLLTLAAAHGVNCDAVLQALARRDLLQRDDSTGAIACAYPFSGRPTPHRVEIDGAPPVFAMCALDALGIPFMLDQDARIRSQDPITGQPVVVEVQVRGSLALFFGLSFLLFFAAMGIGAVIGALAHNLLQTLLLTFALLFQMLFLSGTMAPIENMPTVMQWLTYLSPLRYYLPRRKGCSSKGRT